MGEEEDEKDETTRRKKQEVVMVEKDQGDEEKESMGGKRRDKTRGWLNGKRRLTGDLVEGDLGRMDADLASDGLGLESVVLGSETLRDDEVNDGVLARVEVH